MIMNPITDQILETPLSYVPDTDLPLQGGFAEWELAFHPVMKKSYFAVSEMVEVTALGTGAETPPEFTLVDKHVMAAAYLRIVCCISGRVLKLAYKATDTELLAFDNEAVMTFMRTHPESIVVKYDRFYKYSEMGDIIEEGSNTLSIHGENYVIPTQYAIVDLVDNATGDVLKRLIGPALHEAI